MNIRAWVLLWLMVGGAFLSACASTSTGNADNSRLDFLTREQILESGATNLYDVVDRLRPRSGCIGYVPTEF